MYAYAKNWTLAAALTGVFAIAGCTTHNTGRNHPVSGEVGSQDVRIVADTLPEIVVTASRLAPKPDAEIVVTAHRLPAALQDVPEIVVVASRLPREDGPMTASVETEAGEGALLQ